MDWRVSKEESGSKLLPFLRSKLGPKYSAKALKRAIESNKCQINGRIERFATTVVGTGDQIHFFVEKFQKIEKLSYSVLYQDEDLVVINKPAGMVSENQSSLELVHRLDRDTSGVLIFAKSDLVKQAMIELFRKKQVKKYYLAIVDGVPVQPEGHIQGYLGKVCAYEGQNLWGVVSKDQGLWAETHWKLLKRGKNVSLLECMPITGRTHQLRIHLANLGHPILGDRQYGKKYRCSERPNRCLLHAQKVIFPHPLSGKTMQVEAELPSDFVEVMARLAL